MLRAASLDCQRLCVATVQGTPWAGLRSTALPHTASNAQEIPPRTVLANFFLS